MATTPPAAEAAACRGTEHAIPAHIRNQLAAFGTIPPGMTDADRGQWIALRDEETIHCP